MLLPRRIHVVVLLAVLGGLVLTGCGGEDSKAEKPAARKTTAAPGGSEPSAEPTKKSTKKPSATATTAPVGNTFLALDDARCAQVSTLAARGLGAPAMEHRPVGEACENPDDAFEGDDVDGKAVHVTVNTLPDRFPTVESYVAELRAEADSGMTELRLDGWSYATRVGSAYTLSRVAGKKVLLCSGQGYGSQATFVAFCDGVRDVLLAG